jgi:hypothetical protein
MENKINIYPPLKKWKGHYGAICLEHMAVKWTNGSLLGEFLISEWVRLVMGWTVIDGHVWWNSNRQLSFIICRPSKTNFLFPFLFAANNRKIAVYVSEFQQTKGSWLFLLVQFFHFKWKTETQVMFLNPFTPLCSSCKRNFVVCPFVD